MTGVRVYDVVRLRRDPEVADVTDVWKDFELRHVGLASQVELGAPRVSLYSIDLANAAVIFVEAAESRVLSGAPFFYMAQRKLAKRILVVDIASFLRLYPESAVPPDRLLHLYSVGRCGSTLLHHALNQIDGIVSLSEPDFLFQIASWRKTGRIGVDQAVQLAAASLRYLWRQRPAGCAVLAVKHRGKAIWAFQEFRSACPAARAIFLYRNPTDTIQSFDRMANYTHGRRQWLLNVPVLARLAGWLARHDGLGGELDIYREHLTTGTPAEVVARLGHAGYLLLDWISKMDSYLRLREVDRSCVALRYEDLVAAPEATLDALLAACIPLVVKLDRALTVFARDSQQGTGMQRSQSEAYRLNAATIREIHSVIREQTRIAANLILPGTLLTSRFTTP